MKFYIFLIFIKNIYLCQCTLLELSSDLPKTFKYQFPKNFKFGAATSAYQAEGAWNENGKSESYWDHLFHVNPQMINGDVSSDMFHHLKEDIELMRKIHLNHYRFSLSWTRIISDVFQTKINAEGVKYYNNLIDNLLKSKIEPMVTIFHWDTPQQIENRGGWLNSDNIQYLVNFARVAFELFGDRVKTWFTINELSYFCTRYYEEHSFDPKLNNSRGLDIYLCAHNLLKAHADIWHMYDENFRSNQKGRIGLVSDVQYFYPNSDQDVEATERYLQFNVNWPLHPVFSETGDYPELMKQIIDTNSHNQCYEKSRLPKFTEKEIEYIRGTYDFMGINHYTSFVVKDKNESNPIEASYDNDMNAIRSPSERWPKTKSDWIQFVPDGLRDMLNWIKNQYGNIEILITENGVPSNMGVLDFDRMIFLSGYLDQLSMAIAEDKINVTGYTYWSLLDSLEWTNGYTDKFGLISVNFSSPNRTRDLKASALYYSTIIKEHNLLKENNEYENLIYN